MAVLVVFDPGKMPFFLGAFLVFVVLSEARYTCTYLERTDSWPWGREEMKTRQCNYGCCGEGVDQHCCDEYEDDTESYRLHWIIVASVAGGIAVLCVIIIMVLCALKVKNVKRSRIYDGSAGTQQTRYDLVSPPPPSHHVNVFIIDADRERYRRPVVPPSERMQESPSRLDTRGSDRMQEFSSRPDTREQERTPPVFPRDGLISRPPPYTFLDSNPSNEWKQWES